MPEVSITGGENDITFNSQGCKLSATLHAPANFSPSAQYSTVVFSPPFNQLKEQCGRAYGRKFAAKGYLFLAFDHIGYGESEGVTRNYENANIKIESIRDAISFLGTLPFVAKGALFGLGICASGGYMALVATTDKRLKAVASVSGMLSNKTTYFGSGDRAAAIAAISAANEARQKAYESGEPMYMDALGYASMPKEEIDKHDKESAFYQGYDYYMTKRAGKETHPKYSYMTPANIMEMNALADAKDYAPYLWTPFIAIIGEKANTPGDTGPLTISYYEAATEPKELVILEGASHVSLYDIDRDVDRAVGAMDVFFKRHGKAPSA